MDANALRPIPARAQTAVLDLYRLALDADEPTIFSFAIEMAVTVTGSEIGYFHLVNEDQETIELGTWSAGTLRQCTATYDRHYPISQAGVWADSARHRRPCVHNDYRALDDRRGLPGGHVELVRHLGVPVLSRDRVVLLVGVGNKPADYDDEDLACAQAVADSAWALISRRREQAALELSERQLLDLQEFAAISAWQWDPEDRRLRCDGNSRRIFGIETPQGIPRSIEDLLRFIDPRDREAVLDALRDPAADATFDLDLRGVRADGTAVVVHFRGAAYPRSQGHGVVMRGILQDVTERREFTRIKYDAEHDTLTGLANRAALLAELEAGLRDRRRSREDLFAVHFVDLDRFKPVNDSLGHSAGDAVLKLVADRLVRATRKDDLVARLGGDELVVVQKHVSRPAAAEAFAQKLIAAIGEPMEIAGRRVELGASVGIALAFPLAESAEELLSRADRAMYRAKETSRGSYCVAT
jgi:diguanylate cyclase (GGDEF)-like protein